MKFRESLFWDVDPKAIDPKRHADYVIERIMDFGNTDEVRWMWHTYPRRIMRGVAATSRVLHDKSRMFWSSLLNDAK